MADEQLNVGIGLNVKGQAEAKAAFASLKAAVEETGAAFDAAAVRAKALGDAATAAQALSSQALGIPAEAAGVVNAEGQGAVIVAQEQQAQAQDYINKLKLEAIAVTEAEAAALRVEAAAAAEAAAAQEALAASTAGSTAEAFQAAAADTELAAGETEVGAAATVAAGGTAAFLAPLLELFAAFEAFRGFKDFVETGVGFNSTIESARIGIAAVTTALGTLTDAQGKVLNGEQAFQAGLGIADNQIAKLQVDALRTATTMSDLVTRFQATEGAGLRAGATLDQIRQIVVGASQAAGALNVPYAQLNATLVQLLNGHIRVTNRLTADLGLTSAQVKDWKESGTLVEHLVELFGRFDIIGEHVQGTWRGILSNIRQAFQIFTGEATSGLFTNIEQGVNQALHNVFDFKTGGITSTFTGLAEGLKSGLAAGAQLVVDLIQKMVAGAEDLSHWFETHKEETSEILRNTVDIVESVGRVVLAVTEIATKIVLWAVQSDVVRGAFRALADLTQLIADHLGVIAAIIGLRILGNLATEITAASLATGGLVTGLLSLINPVTAVIAVVGALVIGFEAYRNHQDEITRQAAAARASLIGQSTSVATLVGQYRQLASELESGKLSADKKRQAEEQLKTVTDALIKLSPDYQGAIEAETGKLKEQTQVINDLASAREHDLAQKAADAESEVNALAAKGADLQAQLQAAINTRNTSLGRNFEAAQGDVARLTSEIDRNETALDQAKIAAEQLHQAVVTFRADEIHPPAAAGGVNLKGNTGDDAGAEKDKSKQIEDARIESIKAIAEAQKKYLDDALRQNELSYGDYFARLNAIELTSIDVQIAAKKKLLFGSEVPEPGAQPLATLDAGQKAQLLTDLAKLEQQKTEIVQENAAKRTQLEDALDKKVSEAAVQYLEDTGHAVQAFALKFDAQYREVYARLAVEGDEAGKKVIDGLFQEGVAKAQAEELKKSVETALQAPEQQVKDIQALVKTHAVDEQRGRELVIQAYQRQLQIIEQALAKARELAAAQAVQPTGVAPQTVAEIQDLEDKAARVKDALAEIQLGAQRLKVELSQSLSHDFVDFLEKIAQRGEKGRQVVNDFAASVIESIEKIVAALIQSRIQQALLTLFGVGSGLGATSAGGVASAVSGGVAAGLLSGAFASGGIVHGPGGPTDDRVPAMLSAGEYVVPAHAVATHGSQFFDDIVAGAHMPLARHFASGGLVSPGPVGGHASRGSDPTHIKITHDPGLILDVVSSPPGHKVIVQAAQQNPGAMRQSLRLPSQP